MLNNGGTEVSLAYGQKTSSGTIVIKANLLRKSDFCELFST